MHWEKKKGGKYVFSICYAPKHGCVNSILEMVKRPESSCNSAGWAASAKRCRLYGCLCSSPAKIHSTSRNLQSFPETFFPAMHCIAMGNFHSIRTNEKHVDVRINRTVSYHEGTCVAANANPLLWMELYSPWNNLQHFPVIITTDLSLLKYQILPTKIFFQLLFSFLLEPIE